jgi:hypothetical protein
MLSQAQLERNRLGGHALHQPMNLALRLVRAWPQVQEPDRSIILAALQPMVPFLARACDLGPGRCDRCKQKTDHLLSGKDQDVCAACVGR